MENIAITNPVNFRGKNIFLSMMPELQWTGFSGYLTLADSTSKPVERSKEMERSPLSFVFLLLFTVASGEGVKFPPTSKSSIAGLIPNYQRIGEKIGEIGGQCSLPRELGCSGTLKLLEDCERYSEGES